ncbi:MAG: hypothetical protein COS92_05135 [Desulfobacterales bacterium CG07_land_8_20_14_0_80_52_14]|nr:MAG: hypothetical protein COX20_07265 [Desulfobacterales bacterium CG23_combo_of_CG06-09_8_20_14_all_52_9]PIU49703.1 MAG: hypothetical protein COS92_05135 [Desulfobacterales bacterium CG07_land_8_20_14_0_80_52_14]
MKLFGKIGKSIIFLGVACGLLMPGSPQVKAREVVDPEATLVVPADVLQKIIREVLPVELEKIENLAGRLWVRSIEKLFLGNNIVSFIARVQGKDLSYVRKIAGYPAAVKFGEVDLAFNCSASLSFDRKRRVLIFKPQIRPAEKGNELLTPLLMALVNENEYPVEIEKLKPIEIRLGNSLMLAHTDVSNITTSSNRLMIGISPRIQRSEKK